MEDSTIQTTTENKRRFIIPVHQPAGNSDIEERNDNTAGSHSATKPAGGTARAELNSDEPALKKKSRKRKSSPTPSSSPTSTKSQSTDSEAQNMGKESDSS